MVRLNIITEGQTEETYVRDILYDHLAPHQVYTTPITLVTAVRERTYRGGVSKYGPIRRDVLRSLKDQTAVITTMIDFYRLPRDFPGMEQIANVVDPYEKIQVIEREFMNDIDNSRFIPYIQLHEYEAILFSDIDVIDKVLRVNWHSQIHELRRIISQFSNPEIINDNPNTAPSKRLENLYSPYQKVTDGVRIAKIIPLATVKNKCRHFNDWVTKLEGLADTNS